MLNADTRPWSSGSDPHDAGDRSGPTSSETTALAGAVLEATASLLIVTEIGTGRVVAMNQAVEDLTGYRRDQVIGQPLWEIVAPAQRDKIRRAFTDPAGHSLPESYESTVSLRSGRPRRIVWSSTFLNDSSGVPQHVVMTGIDVSSKSASGGLFAHLMMAANTTALVSTDRRGRVTYFSSAAEQLLGLRGNNLIGKPLPATLFDASELQSRAVELQAPTVLEMLRHTETAMPTPGRGGEFLQEHDWTLVRADGSRLIASISVSTARDATGVHVGYVGLVIDVTERRRANQQLVEALLAEEKAVQRLHELDRAKSDFVETVSHELRTPVTSIVGYTELLQDGVAGPLNSAQLSLIDSIGRSTERLITLGEDLVTLARADAGDLEMDTCDLDLRDVVSNARNALQPLLLDRRLKTSVEMPSVGVRVLGDVAHLGRVVFKLLSNAVKFTDDGGTITCRVWEDEDDAVLEVSDSGVGIPVTEQQHLFTRFFRSSTAQERASQGSGLGLSIVSAIVHQHGGRISVTSEHMLGCTFTVRIPRTAIREEKAVSASPAQPPDEVNLANHDVIGALPAMQGTAPTKGNQLSPACRLYIAASVSGRREEALAIVREAAGDGASPIDVYVDILQTALHEVGRRWQTSGLTIAEEHMATATTQFILSAVHEEHPRARRHGGTAVVTGVLNEEHMVGASIVGEVLDAEGWDVRFMGTNLPHDAIVSAIARNRASLVAISVTMNDGVADARELIAHIRRSSANTPRIIIGGAAFVRDPRMWRTVGADGFAADARTIAELAHC